MKRGGGFRLRLISYSLGGSGTGLGHAPQYYFHALRQLLVHQKVEGEGDMVIAHLNELQNISLTCANCRPRSQLGSPEDMKKS